MDRGYRALRIKRDIYSDKALRDLALRFVSSAGAGKRVLVGFGDWSNADANQHGSPKGPVKRFRQELQKHCTVVMVWEFRTTMVCCWSLLDLLSFNHPTPPYFCCSYSTGTSCLP
jgi:hypothetical protein